MTISYDVVVPTIGRASLARLLHGFDDQIGPLPERILLVDDRPGHQPPLDLGDLSIDVQDRITVVAGRAAGPASARNLGWRESTADWVAFLDDDVTLSEGWCAALSADLTGCGPDVAGSQGNIEVPLPLGRPATDWERNIAGLERARWATADLAYRRRVLAAVDGFDERFPRAYREDADLGLRVTDAGWHITTGQRRICHPVLSAPWTVSLTKQRGNIDDALMHRLHGRGWRDRAGAPPGRLPVHVATTIAWLTAGIGAVTRQRHLAKLATTVAAALTADLAVRRIAPGPKDPKEVATMTVTSLLLPPLASLRRLQGELRVPKHETTRTSHRIEAVLFDRDATLIHDVPYNGDPDQVKPVDDARRALDRLRAAGMRLGIVSNQSGVARGLIDATQVDAVNQRVEELLGPFDVIVWCGHGPDDRCACRKPEPSLILQAAAKLGLPAQRCVVVGDIGADVEAAHRAGTRGILVPTPITRFEEVDAAPEVVARLDVAVDRLLSERETVR